MLQYELAISTLTFYMYEFPHPKNRKWLLELSFTPYMYRQYFSYITWENRKVKKNYIVGTKKKEKNEKKHISNFGLEQPQYWIKLKKLAWHGQLNEEW